MEYVELVIKLPEEVKNRLCFGVTYAQDIKIVCEALYNGIPLPKGHGRLKDVDHYIKMEWEHPDYSLMDDEPTIIEADEAERSGEE